MKIKLLIIFIVHLFVFPAFSLAQDAQDDNVSDMVEISENAEKEEVDDSEPSDFQDEDQIDDSEDDPEENEDSSSEQSDESIGTGSLTLEEKPKPKIKRKPQTETKEETPPENSSPEVAEEQETKSDEADSVEVVDTIAGANTVPDWINEIGVSDYSRYDYSTNYFIAGAGITVILAIGGFVFIRLRRKKSLSEHTDSAVAKDIAEIDSVKTPPEVQTAQQTQTLSSSSLDLQKSGFTPPVNTNNSGQKEAIDLSNLPANPLSTPQIPSQGKSVPPNSPDSSNAPGVQIKSDTAE